MTSFFIKNDVLHLPNRLDCGILVTCSYSTIDTKAEEEKRALHGAQLWQGAQIFPPQ